MLEGEGITVHADVFGHVVSRGGAIVLNRNLVGGSARNARSSEASLRASDISHSLGRDWPWITRAL